MPEPPPPQLVEHYRTLRGVLRGLKKVRWEHGDFIGVLDGDERLAATLRELDNAEPFHTHVTVTDPHRGAVPVSSLSGGGEPEGLQIRVAPHNSQTCRFCSDLDDLLAHHAFRWQAPALFYLADLDFLSSDAATAVAAPIRRYLNAVDVIGLLAELADYVDTSEAQARQLVFLAPSGRRLRVPLVYSSSDLRDLPDVGTWRETLRGKPHQAEKQGLFKVALMDHLSQAAPEAAVPLFLAQAARVWLRFEENYQLFVSEFVFESERERLESRKRQYMTRMDGIISEMRNQILALPLSLVLVGSQMRAAEDAAVLLANVALLLGSAIVTVVLLILTGAQRHALEAISSEVKERRARWEREAPNLFREVNRAFEELQKRADRVELDIHVLRTVTWLVQIIAVMVFALQIPAVLSVVHGWLPGLWPAPAKGT